MGRNTIKRKPIAEQIAEYEREVQRIDARIANCKKNRAQYLNLIAQLKAPDDEEKYQKHLRNIEREEKRLKRKNESTERKHERMQREVEECLRMNGKIL